MNVKEDCIHLKCRYLKVLYLSRKEIKQFPVYDQCALNLIIPHWGCNPYCKLYKSDVDILPNNRFSSIWDYNESL